MGSQLFFISSQKPWPIFKSEQIRAIEKQALLELGNNGLMQRAGLAIAKYIESIKDKMQSTQPKIIFLVGPGNNGGDALQAIRHLSPDHWRCHIVCPMLPVDFSNYLNNHAEKKDSDVNIPIQDFVTSSCFPDRSHLSQTNTQLLQSIASLVQGISSDVDKALLLEAEIIVDGLFGIGLKRPLDSTFQALIQKVNRYSNRSTVLALDIPSGLNADTGQSMDHQAVIQADVTLTFIALKPGLFTGKARDYVGDVFLASLGITAGLNDDVRNLISNTQQYLEIGPAFNYQMNTIQLNSPSLFIKTIPPRLASAHKGDYGTLAIVGGSQGMSGAAILAARAGLLCGAGRVNAILLAQSIAAYDFMYPEIMIKSGHQPNSTILKQCRANVYVIGPGLGREEQAEKWLDLLLLQSKPTVIDADGLIMLKKAEQKWLAFLANQANNRQWILTPHPGEAAYLLNCSIDEIENNRMQAALKLAKIWQATVILKGSGTIIAREISQENNKYQLQFVINPTGNVGLASGGSGDTLAGVIGSLLAQGMLTFEAALAAVFWHGQAAENLTKMGIGPIGLAASELPYEIRRIRNQTSL